MFALLHSLAMFVMDFFKSPRRLEAENLFLRHQLSIALRIDGFLAEGSDAGCDDCDAAKKMLAKLVLASTRQLMSMSSHVFGKAVAGSVEAGFAELFGFADCDFGERELGSVAGSPCGYNNPTLNRWRVILRSRG